MKLSITLLTAIVAYANAIALEKRGECTPGTRTINGRTCTIQCGVDRPGGDYGLSRTGTWEACVQACAADYRCITAQYHEDNKFCYFKNSKNQAVVAAADDTVDCGPSPNGSPCATNSQCSSNSCNVGSSSTGTCELAPDGTSCTTSSQCNSGYCDPSKSICAYPTVPDGSTCYQNKDCTSGFCNSNSKCGKVPNGSSCKNDADCTNNVCNTYYNVCGIDLSGCYRNTECSSNVCTSENRCGPIADGGTCYRSSDCTSKYCNTGNGMYGQAYCGLGGTGAGCTQNSQCVSNKCDTQNKVCLSS